MKLTHNITLQRKQILMLVGAAALLIALIGIIERHFHYRALRKEVEDLARVRVTIIHAEPAPKERKLDLPANLAAWYQAPIYAQVSGYVKMWYKDYGAHVKTGDILAEISTPSLDAQYEAAKANYEVVAAQYRLAVITAERWAALRNTQAVSRQEVDVQAANAAAKKAQVDQARHEVERFEALENFKKIVAPFDGIVTSRRVNVGDYVNEGSGDLNGRGGASELFTVADIHRIRVFISIPQAYASIISDKLSAKITVPQYPGRKFTAAYLATAQAFSPATRTVVTELALDNTDHILWPDSYATAHFIVPGTPDILIIPVNALIFRAQGTQVAMVVDHHIHLVSVETGINYGMTIQIIDGVKPGDDIVGNPTADMMEGDEVKIVPTTKGYNDKAAQSAAPPNHPVAPVQVLPDRAAPEHVGAIRK